MLRLLENILIIDLMLALKPPHFNLRRTLHDVKATGIGSSHIRFKAEVDFDGRELTRLYLEKFDLDKLQKVHLPKNYKFKCLDMITNIF